MSTEQKKEEARAASSRTLDKSIVLENYRPAFALCFLKSTTIETRMASIIA
jgi:hypothetical protein